MKIFYTVLQIAAILQLVSTVLDQIASPVTVLVSVSVDNLNRSSLLHRPNYFLALQDAVFDEFPAAEIYTYLCLYCATGPVIHQSLIASIKRAGMKVLFPDADTSQSCFQFYTQIHSNRQIYLSTLDNSCEMILCKHNTISSSCNNPVNICSFLQSVSSNRTEKHDNVKLSLLPFDFDGACKLWWPLDNTTLFLYTKPHPSSSISFKIAMNTTAADILLLSCPLLPTSLPAGFYIKVKQHFYLQDATGYSTIEKILISTNVNGDLEILSIPYVVIMRNSMNHHF